MLFKKSKIKISLALLAIICNGFQIYSQKNSEISLYNWFDTIVGKENLGINNGPLQTNPYKTIGQNNMYYIADKYSKGDVIYDGQTYYDVNIKYDIYKDELILNPYGESEHIGLILIKDKIESFSIKDKRFVKIEKKDNDLPEFTTGYYEENEFAPDFIFYIKHHKDIQKGINDDGVFYNFKENHLFFIYLKNKTYQIKSKNDIIKLFPEQKKQINTFYSTNREILKSDKNQFMENLMKYINNFISNTSK